MSDRSGIFLVFDDHVELQSLSPRPCDCKADAVTLFSLGARTAVLNDVRDALRPHYSWVSCLDSAKAISQEVRLVRDGICKWSAKIGDAELAGKKIKEWFLLPGLGVSAWWFGLISEKNTLKTDAFLQVAQVHAVKRALREGRHRVCAVAVSDPKLRKAISCVAELLGVEARILPSRPAYVKMKTRIKRWVQGLGLAGDLIFGLNTWFGFLTRCRVARRRLGVLSKRLPASEDLLIVTYFPAVDEEAARQGVFRNKYSGPLQDRLKELDIPVAWLLMCVDLYRRNYESAVDLAAKFAENGEKFCILEEFLTAGTALRALFLWIRQVMLSIRLLRFTEKGVLLSGPVGKECALIMKHLWHRSFCGYAGMEGIMYALLYRAVFTRVPRVADCMYYCEMHAWEKALNAARKHVQPGLRTIGFQHTSVPRNYFAYSHDRSETMPSDDRAALPLPDVLACNGELTCSLLAESGYPCIVQVEALRHVYLDRTLSAPREPRNGKPVLLVAGSFDRTESLQLITLVNEAFPGNETCEVWFKAHPLRPFESLFEELGIEASKCGYRLCDTDISECLKKATAVLVVTGTVAIEALAMGCRVVVPVFPNSMLVNPLTDFDEECYKVTSPEELRSTMRAIVSGCSCGKTGRLREFVKKYWFVDSSLPRWTELLLSGVGRKHHPGAGCSTKWRV